MPSFKRDDRRRVHPVERVTSWAGAAAYVSRKKSHAAAKAIERRQSYARRPPPDKEVAVAGARAQWGATLDFILSCIGYAVGLGNLTRFPYICGRNGGASFLIPYVIMMVLAGLPTFYLELAIGQFSRVSPYMLYRRMCPIFTGLGSTMIVISLLTAIYYNIYMSWSLRYTWDIIWSFTDSSEKMPFSGCRHSWNDALCLDGEVYEACVEAKNSYFLGECYNQTANHCNFTSSQLDKIVQLMKNLSEHSMGVSPSQEYNDYLLGNRKNLWNGSSKPNTCAFEFDTFNHDPDVFVEWAWPYWDMVLSLLVAWILSFFVLIRGVDSFGKVVYVTSTIPYLILLALLIVGNTLDGSMDGIKFYMIPDFDILLTAQPWIDAASQIFFSLSVGGGGLTTLSSFNNFNNNLLRDTLIVVLGNCATSIFAGFVIFPILGYEAKRLYPNIKDYKERVGRLASAGPTLAFVGYPGALSQMFWPQVWTFLFFIMLIMLGINTEIVMVEVVIMSIVDTFPVLRIPWWRAAITALVCALMFLSGIVMLSPVSGPQLVNLVDTFAGGWTLVIACGVEVIMVSWVYGMPRFMADIRMMMGVPPNKFWKIMGYPANKYWQWCWKFITPFVLMFILVVSFATYELKYEDKSYPEWGELLGFGMSIFCVIFIPIYMVGYSLLAYIKNKGLKWLVKPTPQWGPGEAELMRKLRRQHPFHMRESGWDTGAPREIYTIDESKF